MISGVTIARETGYGPAKALFPAFKRETGSTPGTYRGQHAAGEALSAAGSGVAVATSQRDQHRGTEGIRVCEGKSWHRRISV